MYTKNFKPNLTYEKSGLLITGFVCAFFIFSALNANAQESEVQDPAGVVSEAVIISDTQITLETRGENGESLSDESSVIQLNENSEIIKDEVSLSENDTLEESVREPMFMRSMEGGEPTNYVSDRYTSPVVSESNGGLSYEYQVTVPPGKNGLSPDVKFLYNSSYKPLNSIVAPGWSIGIPFIQRLNKGGTDKIYSKDFFTSSIDGELVDQGNGIFAARTQNGTFLKYQYNNNGWSVTDKTGTVYSFGTTAQARQANPSDSTEVYTWMLETVTDSNGNTIDYTYYKDQGQIYPDNIIYNQEGLFEVNFGRTASQPSNDSYASGFLVRNTYRIDDVSIYVDDVLSSKYELSYDSGSLESIELTGYESSQSDSLPITTFEYSTNIGTGWGTTTSQTLPTNYINGDYERATVFTDVNGDGHTDIVTSPKGTDFAEYNRTFLNVNGSYNDTPSWYIPETYGFDSPNAWLADMNSDGLPDIVRNSDGGILLNNGNGWSTTTYQILPTNYINGNYENATVFVDVNGDGTTDIVTSPKGTDFAEYNRTFLNVNGSYNDTPSWYIPETYGFDNPNAWLADMNSDGLPDLIRNSDGAILFNNGNGWNTNPDQFLPTNYINGDYERATVFTDVNGDGHTDIVTSPKGTDFAEYNRTFLNVNGSYNDTPSWYIPETYGFDSPNAWLADMNSDGLPDIVRNSDGGILLNNGNLTNNLSKITTSYGEESTINYSIAQTDQYNHSTPFLVPVVDSIVADDNGGAFATTTYEYKEAEFYFASSTDKRFAGFGEVVKTNPDGSVVVTKHHQANDEEGNELADSYAKIGKVYEEAVFDDSNNLYQLKRYNFSDQTAGTNSTSSLLSSEVQLQYDGTSTHVDTAKSYTYDAYGNVLVETQYGEVAGTVDGAFTDTGSDKKVTELTYVNNINAYIVGLPLSQELKNNSGNLVAGTNLKYDESGSLLEEGEWISNTDYATTTFTYNSFGLVLSETDALSNTTSYDYGTNNLYPETVTNAVNHEVDYTYDYSSGKPKIITNDNGKTTEFYYDGLDRFTEEKQTVANGGVEAVRTRQYNTSSNPQYYKDKIYRSAGGEQDMRVYLDGLGREIQKKTEYEGGWATVDTEYDNMGRVEKVSIPYTTATIPNSSMTSVSELLSVSTYDPLDRLLTITNARGVTSNNYDGFTNAVIDAEGNIKSYTTDAFNNLVEVQENNGIFTYTTSYTYDAQDNLNQIVDAEGNERGISYDGLGRRTELEDLHSAVDTTFGVWTFDYDDVNLVSAIDPEGNETSYTYDGLNRVLTEDSDSVVGIELKYAYDSCTNGIGNVCIIVSDAATTSYTYFKQGQVADEIVIIDGNSYTKSSTYNWQNQPVSITYPNSDFVTYEYNQEGLLSQVSLDGLSVASSTYGVHGMPTSLQHANNTVTNYYYDEDDLYGLEQIITGNSTSSELEIVVASTTTTPQSEQTALLDNFSQGLAVNWTNTQIKQWTSLSSRASAIKCFVRCAIELNSTIDLTNASSSNLGFNFYAPNTLDNGEYLKAKIHDGTAWNQIGYWTNGSGTSNYRQYLSYDMSQFLGDDIKIRFTAKSSSNNEPIFVDNISLVYTPHDEVLVSTSTATTTEYGTYNEIQNLEYEYDNVGNITSIVDSSVTDTAKTQSFIYDDLYRLTNVSATNVATGTTPYTQSFSYSPVGNITSFDGTALTYTGNGYSNPHAVTSVGGQTYTYSNNGNLTSDGTWTNTWDYRNRLLSSILGTSTSSYTYNHENTRMKLTEGTSTTLYPFSDYEITDGNPKLYLSVGEKTVASISGTTTNHLHRDHLGGTTLTTDENANITQTIDYYPFGEARIDEGINQETDQFTGHKKDYSTGLSYMGARYYDGQVGRFTAQDQANLDLGSGGWEDKYDRPLEIFLRDPQQLNTYSYARNNPVINTDPGGDIIPVVLAIGYAGLMIYDVYDTANTLADPSASAGSKIIAAGLFASPVGEVKAAGKLSKKGLQAALNRQKGALGEKNAGIIKNTEKIPSASNPGKSRIPDALDHDAKVIGEVKNVNYQSLTSQLRDFSDYAQKNSYNFVLNIDQRTQLSKSIQQLGDRIKIIRKKLNKKD